MKKTFIVVIILVALALFWLADTWHPCVSMDMVTPSLPARKSTNVKRANYSPLFSFLSVSLGGFRGLLSDSLWLRAADLQDKKRFLELVQLAEWITSLEPHSIDTWSYQSWNMAYNISVLFAHPADRWRWVQHGLHLIRDEGVEYNPQNPKIYWETGWIYQHKIGGTSDDASPYYRQQFALEVERVCPQGRLAKDPSGKSLIPNAEFLDAFHLNQDTLFVFEKHFGRMDWRLPETHAAYWAYGGRIVAGTKGSVQCDRMLLTALVDLFYKGNLRIDQVTGYFLQTPDFDRLNSILNAFAIISTSPHGEWVQDVQNDFLNDAQLYLLAFGETPLFRQLMGTNVTTDITHAESTMKPTIRRLASEHIKRRQPTAVMAAVTSLCNQAFRCRAMGDDTASQSYFLVARAFLESLGESSNITLLKRIGDDSWNSVCNELPGHLRDKLLSSGPGINPQNE